MAGNSRNDNHAFSQELGLLGNSAGSSPRINISDVVGADLKRLDLPHMVEVLRGAYERKNGKLIFRPNTFRARTQAGTLTDLQASMFKSFQDNQEEFNTLLDHLTPLKPDADQENCDAVRELVRADVAEMVEESGWLGGPRKIKFDNAYNKCVEHLKMMASEFGLALVYDVENGDIGFSASNNVKTALEAENEARWFRILEIVVQLVEGYRLREDFLDRNDSESFGNQLVWLGRCLSTLKEAALRLQTQLDDEGVGIEELSSRNIPPPTNITIAELLQWTGEVCDNGVLLSSRAGKLGMASLWTDLENLGEGYTTLYDNRTTIGIDELDEEDIHDTFKDIIEAIVDAMRYADPSKDPPPFEDQFKNLYMLANPNGTSKQLNTKRQLMLDTAFDRLMNIEQKQSNLVDSVNEVARQHTELVKITRENASNIPVVDDLYFMPDSGLVGATVRIYLYVRNPGPVPTLVQDFMENRLRLRLLLVSATGSQKWIDTGSCEPIDANIIRFDFGTKLRDPGLYSVQVWDASEMKRQFERRFVMEKPKK